jgi:hypothetical protein
MNFEKNEAVSFVTAAEEYIRKVTENPQTTKGWPGTYWLAKGYDVLTDLLEVEPGEHTTKHYENVAIYVSDIIDEWEWFLIRLRADNKGIYRAIRYIFANVVNSDCLFCKGRLVRCKCMCDNCGRMIVTQHKGVWSCQRCK